MIVKQAPAWLATVLTGSLLAGCVSPGPRSAELREARGPVRQALFAALTPVELANCTLKRFGDQRDGGYLMCGNLMEEAHAAYSYGIGGRDRWGCDVSQQLRAAVHEYDCFDRRRPVCEGGVFRFHAECIGDQIATIKGRRFDTLSDQLDRNGDADTRLIVKMDVEGAEWAALGATPDSVLARIDQLAIEFHGTDDVSFVATAEKLARHFYVAHFHANNSSCTAHIEPFTARANEVLFVNKRLGVLGASGARPTLPSPLDALNARKKPDCQPIF